MNLIVVIANVRHPYAACIALVIAVIIYVIFFGCGANRRLLTYVALAVFVIINAKIIEV